MSRVVKFLIVAICWALCSAVPATVFAQCDNQTCKEVWSGVVCDGVGGSGTNCQSDGKDCSVIACPFFALSAFNNCGGLASLSTIRAKTVGLLRLADDGTIMTISNDMGAPAAMVAATFTVSGLRGGRI